MVDRRDDVAAEFKIPPIKTWSGLIAVLSGVATIITMINVSVNWFDTHVQKVSTTTQIVAQLKQEFKLEVDKLKEENKKQDLNNNRRDAWATVGQLDIKSMVLQFRLNECQIKSDERKPTPMEKQICDQYRQEKEDVVNRYKEAWRDAMSVGKDTNSSHPSN